MHLTINYFDKTPVKNRVLVLLSSTAIFAIFTQAVKAESVMNRFLLDANKVFTSDTNYKPAQEINPWDSWVEDSEIRINAGNLSSVDHFTDANNQSYSFRVKLKNAKQRAAEHDLLVLEGKKNDTENQIFYLAELRKRYAFILKILGQKQKIDTLSHLLKLTKLEASTFKKLVTTSNFDPSRIQQSDLLVTQLTAQIRTNNKVMYRGLALMGVSVENKQKVHQFLNRHQWLIGINEMVNVVEKTIDESMNNPGLQQLNLATRISKKQSQLADAELLMGVKLVEIEYDQDKDLFGATVGVRIPLGKSSYNSLRRSNGYKNAQLTWEHKLSSLKSDISDKKNLLRQYQDAYKLEKQLQASVNRRMKRIMKTNRPELILSLKKELIKHQGREQEVYLKMVDVYLDLITISGLILKQPLRNWLQKGRPQIGKNHG